jgi:hypothetical protein
MSCDYGNACQYPDTKTAPLTHQCWWEDDFKECDRFVHVSCALAAGDNLPHKSSLLPGCLLHIRRAEEPATPKKRKPARIRLTPAPESKESEEETQPANPKKSRSW